MIMTYEEWLNYQGSDEIRWCVEYTENGKIMHEYFYTEYSASVFAVEVNGIVTKVGREIKIFER